MLKTLAALFGYLVICLAVTYPMPLKMDTAIYGLVHDNTDTLHYMFALQQVYHHGVAANPFPFVNFPHGIDLFNRYPMYTSEAFVRLFAYAIPSPMVAFNLLIITKFVLTCLGMYFLVSYVTKSRLIGWITGAAFGFSPYFPLLVVGYGPIFLPVFLPLVVLFGLKFIESPTLKSFLSFLGIGILFFGEHFYYTYFLITTILAVLPFFLLFRFKTIRAYLKKHRHFFGHKVAWTGLGLIMILGLVAYKPATDHWQAIKSERNFQVQEAQGRAAYFDFYRIPSIGNFYKGDPHAMNLWGVSIVSSAVENFETGIYLGLLPACIFLIGWLLFFLFSQRDKTLYIFFTLMILTSFLSALGPYPLRIFSALPIWVRNLEGPDYLFFQIAPMFRFTVRYHVVTLLGLLLAFALGLNTLLKALKPSRMISTGLTLAAFLVLAIEYGNWGHYNVRNVIDEMPEALKELAKGDEIASVLEFPRDDLPTLFHYHLWQVFHHQKNSWGFQDIDLTKDGDIQRIKNAGFKYVMIMTKPFKTTRQPLQRLSGDAGLEKFKDREAFGPLKLVKKFDDSLLFSF